MRDAVQDQLAPVREEAISSGRPCPITGELLTGIPHMAEPFDAIQPSGPDTTPRATENGRRWRLFAAPEPENADVMLIRTQFSRRFAFERMIVRRSCRHKGRWRA